MRRKINVICSHEHAPPLCSSQLRQLRRTRHPNCVAHAPPLLQPIRQLLRNFLSSLIQHQNNNKNDEGCYVSLPIGCDQYQSLHPWPLWLYASQWQTAAGVQTICSTFVDVIINNNVPSNDSPFLQWKEKGFQTRHTAFQGCGTAWAETDVFLQKVRERRTDGVVAVICASVSLLVLSLTHRFHPCYSIKMKRRLCHLSSVPCWSCYQALCGQGSRGTKTQVTTRKGIGNQAVVQSCSQLTTNEKARFLILKREETERHNGFSAMYWNMSFIATIVDIE